MKQEEYLAAIKKQQSLIRKLTTGRQRRSEVIQEITKERYSHLIGKFILPKEDGNHFLYEKGHVTYFIFDVKTESRTEVIKVSLLCRSLCPTRVGSADGPVEGLSLCPCTFSFSYDENIDEILAPIFVMKEKAMEEMSTSYKELIKNFLRKG